MIEPGHGNLLTADVDAIVNTVGVMGKGIALQFKRAYPDNYQAYRTACESGVVRLGRMFVHDRAVLGPRRFIVNFPTKAHWRSSSTLEDIRAGLADLVRVVQDLSIESVAIPALGCGNGGLDWADVRPLIESAAAEVPDVRIVVFAPEGAPDPKAMPVATPRPPMSLLYATLITAIGRYLQHAASLEPREGISELEIQKLAYFTEVMGAPLSLRFSRGQYGPYAEQLHPILQALEGHYLVGYGDRSARVSELQPIQLLSGSVESADAYLRSHPPALQTVDRLLGLIDGFESPYSMELMATVHYVAHYPEPVVSSDELLARVSSWSRRKARLFTEHHVSVASERLAGHGLLGNPIRMR